MAYDFLPVNASTKANNMYVMQTIDKNYIEIIDHISQTLISSYFVSVSFYNFYWLS